MFSPPVWVAPLVEVLGAKEHPEETPLMHHCEAAENVANSLRGAVSATPGESLGILWGPGPIRVGPFSWQRLRSVQDDTGAGMVYGNYSTSAGETELLPTRLGSLRDEFDTGPMWLVWIDHLKSALDDLPSDLNSLEAVRYGLRLGLMRQAPSVMISEPLCSTVRTRDEDIFAYIRPDAREKQREMESVLTDHLVKINALLPPRIQPYVDKRHYALKATVVIPVRNREHTIKDAVTSALSQETTFPFNVVVVDNHSSDATRREALQGAEGDKRLQILTPTREDLGIGGCWNLAARSGAAGRYLVQLDSDDVYATAESVQIIVDVIDGGPWAMAVGSYRTVDMSGNEVPPGDVTHEEWTDENGHNNLLRVSGVGAPRVLATGFLRENPMPNVSYGEDYAVALRASREYHVARHFGIVYNARRWEGNTDYNADPKVVRSRESYKDQLRTFELEARMTLLRASHDHLG